MSDYATRPTLIVRIKDAEDEEAWSEFVEIYTPMMSNYCLRRGVSREDTADIVQEAMKVILRAIRNFEYDPSKGRFRSWIHTVARTRLCNYVRSQARHPRPTGGTIMLNFIQDHPDEDEVRDWELEYRRQMFQWAADRVKDEFTERSWQAFWKTSVEDQPVTDVCDALEMKPGTLYVARSRIIARLRKEIESVDGEWDMSNE